MIVTLNDLEGGLTVPVMWRYDINAKGEAKFMRRTHVTLVADKFDARILYDGATGDMVRGHKPKLFLTFRQAQLAAAAEYERRASKYHELCMKNRGLRTQVLAMQEPH